MENKMQWIKGEKYGRVETVIDTNGEWTLFKDGGRINSDLLEEFLVPVNNENDLIFQNANTNLIKSEKIEKIENAENTNSPIRQLLDNQRELDKADLSISFKLNVPKKDIFRIISNSFNKTNVNNELKNYILDQLKETIINDEIDKSIDSLIFEQYK